MKKLIAGGIVFFFMLSPLAGFAGFSKILKVVGKIGDFDQSTVEIKDAQGNWWSVDRSAFRKDFDLHPGAKIAVRVSPDHIRKLPK
jgi:hypothetical protein